MSPSPTIAQLKARVELTEYEAGEYESGGQRVDKIVRFATVDCVKAGWLFKNKGRWQITSEGRAAYDAITDPEAFARRALQLYNQWRAATRVKPTADTPDEEAKEIGVTYERAEEDAWREIDQYLRTMPPYEFQELVASLLQAMGYYVSWISPPGKDGGIDIVAWPDPLGTRHPRIKVQVKRHQNSVGVDGLRSFMAILGDGDIGIFVATGGFTKDAADEARGQEKRRVTLIDLERLFDLWVSHYGTIPESARRRLALTPVYFLSPQA